MLPMVNRVLHQTEIDFDHRGDGDGRSVFGARPEFPYGEDCLLVQTEAQTSPDLDIVHQAIGPYLDILKHRALIFRRTRFETVSGIVLVYDRGRGLAVPDLERGSGGRPCR